MLSNKIEENGARLWWSKNLLLKTHHCLECTSNGIFSANCYKLLKLPRFNTFLVQHPGCIQDIPRRRSRASSPWTLITAIFWLHFRGNHPGYRRFNFDSPVSSLCRASGPSSWDQHFALAHGEGEMAFFEPIRRWQEGGSERNWRQLEIIFWLTKTLETLGRLTIDVAKCPYALITLRPFLFTSDSTFPGCVSRRVVNLMLQIPPEVFQHPCPGKGANPAMLVLKKRSNTLKHQKLIIKTY